MRALCVAVAMTWAACALPALAAASSQAAAPTAAASRAPPPADAAAARSVRAKGEARLDGSSADAFAASLAALEEGMGDAAKLALHMKLAQVRAKLAEQRGRPLTDAEFAATLDGKTLADLGLLADAAPTHITIDIETSDDT